jgi:pyruvate,water dikinase
MKYIVHFEDNHATEPLVVGHKFSALASAFRAGFAVPPAVAISAEVHRYFLGHKSWPPGLLAEVADAARALGLKEGVSIRSSGIREDLEQQSFAGLYRSFLAVVHEKDLKGFIEQCWESAESESIRTYTRSTLPENSIPLMGVILQQMVPAAYAGVAFSRNPMHLARNEIVIEGIQGLAENLVSGRTSPHRAVIDIDNNLTVTAPPESTGRKTPYISRLLQDDQWLAIADFVRELGAFADETPLDIEWAIDHQNRLWLLQLRTITTLDKQKLILPAGIWTRKIADDLWADRLTPFLAHEMIKNAPRFDLTGILKSVGLPAATPTMTVINGYLYINTASLEGVLAYVPRKFRFSELRTLFPPDYDLNKIPSVNVFRKTWVALRSTLLPFKEPGINPLICLWLSPRSQKKINRRLEAVDGLSDNTPELALDKLLVTLNIMTRIQIKNQWPYSHATFFIWILRWMMVDRLGMSNSDFLKLLSRAGDNITVEVERKFKELAKIIAEDNVLKTRFLTQSPDQLALDLAGPFKNELDAFLGNYGCRSAHRTLYVPRWAEAPETVIGILQSLTRHRSSRVSDSRNGTPAALQGAQPGEGVNRVDSMSYAIWRQRGEKYRPITRLAVWLIHKFALQFLDLREDLRFLLDKVLFQIRKTLLVLGRQTGLGERIVFLNREEIKQLVHGQLSIDQARLRASRRHHIFSKPFEPSTFLIDGQPVNEFPVDTGVMRGTGTSPGRVTGRARIVEDPSRADIRPGDILIAINTDPGWTPVLSVVRGMVVEEGGLLNHCSIVARELGIPSIVGVRQATKRIPDGSVITIDGGLGLIRIE